MYIPKPARNPRPDLHNQDASERQVKQKKNKGRKGKEEESTRRPCGEDCIRTSMWERQSRVVLRQKKQKCGREGKAGEVGKRKKGDTLPLGNGSEEMEEKEKWCSREKCKPRMSNNIKCS
jgi:hypothetical protein